MEQQMAFPQRDLLPRLYSGLILPGEHPVATAIPVDYFSTKCPQEILSPYYITLDILTSEALGTGTLVVHGAITQGAFT